MRTVIPELGPHFGACLTMLVRDATLARWRGHRLRVWVQLQTGTDLPRQRTALVETAIAAGADYVLFLDDDMTFPRSLLHRMLDAGKDVVAANYMHKNLSGQTTTRMAAGDWPGPPVDSSAATGLARVDFVGTGVLLIKAAVLAKLPRPWFSYRASEASEGFDISEDYFLCRRLREAGISVWVDHDLSRNVGHIGPVIFTPQCVTTEQHLGDDMLMSVGRQG